MDAPATPRGPASIEWRVHIATLAMWFFHWEQTNQLSAAGKEKVPGKLTPLSGTDFIQFLDKHKGEGHWPLVPQVERILRRLLAAGLISTWGGASGMTIAANYLTVGGALKSQQGGHLWLSEALGLDLVLHTYGPLTVAIPGTTSDGDAACGSGMLVGAAHVLTCAHVVDDMTLDGIVVTGAMAGTETPRPIVDVRSHADIDVAVVEVEPGPDTPPGIVFRAPVWGDPISIYGYPPVPNLAALVLLMQTGEVVSPRVPTVDGRQLFLFSAIARPGNSGGPVVGADGRVLGIVTRELKRDGDAVVDWPHFAAVPGDLVLHAASELGYEGLLAGEDWAG